MKSFLIRCAIIAIVPILLVIVPLYIIETSGETFSLEEMIQRQQQDTSVLIGCVLSYVDPFLKAEKSRQINPDILVLGTSRTMQFRHYFFNPAFIFYNAGGGVSNIQEFLYFLEQTQVKPQVLMISLDQYFFNSVWVGTDPVTFNYKYSCSPTTMLLSNMRSIYGKLKDGRIRLTQLRRSSSIGLLAKCDGEGFRQDGSYFYNRIISNPSLSEDFQFQNTYLQIEKGIRRFVYNDSVCQNSIEILDRFLTYCYNHSIEVIAYLPPYAPAVWKKMIATGNYSYMTRIDRSIRPLFEKYKYTLYDFSDGETFGSNDTEFIDGFHGSEKTYLRMMLEMVRKDSCISSYFRDTLVLKKMISACPDIHVDK